MVIFIVGKFASLKIYDDMRDIFPFCLLQTVGLTKAVFCDLFKRISRARFPMKRWLIYESFTVCCPSVLYYLLWRYSGLIIKIKFNAMYNEFF